MKFATHFFAAWLAGSALLFTGCGGKSPEEKAAPTEGGNEETDGGVSFKAGRGLQLNPGVIKALGLTTAEAAERPLAAELRLTAQVFATAPQVLASARRPASEAGLLEKYTRSGATLVRLDRAAAATGSVDAVFALATIPVPAPGDFVELTLVAPPATVLAIPRSALLESAAGTFVYVVNGAHYLRTPVKTGARSADFVEITDGLDAGDIVVTAPVAQLWLAELRLTKGGGHND
jgi:hypothetical protein